MTSFLFLLSCITMSFNAFSNDMTFPSASVQSLTVSLSKGSININGEATNKDIIVSMKDLRPGPESAKCLKKMGLNGNELNVSVSNENGLFEKASCEFEITISFNAKTLINPDSLIKARSSSGSIVINNVSTDLDIVTASGNTLVNANQLRNVTAKSATGNQVFVFKNCPKRADIDLVTATGQMNFKLPSNCKIKVDYKSAAGKLFNPIGESADYLIKIGATSASGDLTLAKF